MIAPADKAIALELLCGIVPITDDLAGRLAANRRYEAYALHLVEAAHRAGVSPHALPAAVWANGRQCELPTRGRVRRARTALKRSDF